MFVSVSLDVRLLNEKIKQLGFKGWAFEYDEISERYCLSVFDVHNPEDELVFYLKDPEMNTITHGIRYKGNGVEKPLNRNNQYFKTAKKIIEHLFNEPNTN